MDMETLQWLSLHALFFYAFTYSKGRGFKYLCIHFLVSTETKEDLRLDIVFYFVVLFQILYNLGLMFLVLFAD